MAKMQNTFGSNLLTGNDRLVHNALFCMDGKGNIKEIVSFQYNFYTKPVKEAIRNLVKLDFVKYNYSIHKYELIK